MGADQVAAMQPAVVEIYSAPTSEDWCATFEVPGTEHWVQVVRNMLNANCPYDDDPQEPFAPAMSLLPDAELTSWEAGTFATFSHGDCAPYDIARAVDAVFVVPLGGDAADYQVDVSMEQL